MSTAVIGCCSAMSVPIVHLVSHVSKWRQVSHFPDFSPPIRPVGHGRFNRWPEAEWTWRRRRGLPDSWKASSVRTGNPAQLGSCGSCPWYRLDREGKRTMKTISRIGLVGLSMLVMAGSAQGADYPVTVFEDESYKFELTSPNVAVYTLSNSNGSWTSACFGEPGYDCTLLIYKIRGVEEGGIVLVQSSDIFRSAKNTEIVTAILEYDTSYSSGLLFTDPYDPYPRQERWALERFRTHANPTDPDPEPPAPEPPAPEPPAPEPPAPEPETPDPEPETPEPDACPVEPRCDHIAIVPGMPRAMSGDEGTPDHWLRITNPYGEGINFVIEGRNEAGTKFGTYRRELPAYRSVRVKMRDIEAAFDATKPAGWWTLTVTGNGTLHVIATTKQGDVRIPLPVVQPEICESR